MSNWTTTCFLDLIPSSFLQDITHDILSFLTTLINSSLTSGIISAPFKSATIKPLLKNLPQDSSFTLEHAVYNQLSSYLSQNDLLDPNQSGFRFGHSPEMALLTVTESLGGARALSNLSVLILLNLSSVFDTVNHLVLLSTLAELGITDSAATWFNLTNHTFQFTWNGSLSKPCFLEMGFPVFTIHYITRFCNNILWILLPLLCWQRQSVPLISPILLQHPHCNVHLRMFGRYLSLDSCGLPQTQP